MARIGNKDVHQGSVMMLGPERRVEELRARRLGIPMGRQTSGSMVTEQQKALLSEPIVTIKQKAKEVWAKGGDITEKTRLWDHEVLIISCPKNNTDSVDFVVITNFKSSGFKPLQRAIKRDSRYRKFYCPIEGECTDDRISDEDRSHPDTPSTHPMLALDDGLPTLQIPGYVITQPVYSIDPQYLYCHSLQHQNPERPYVLCDDSIRVALKLIRQHTGYVPQHPVQHIESPRHCVDNVKEPIKVPSAIRDVERAFLKHEISQALEDLYSEFGAIEERFSNAMSEFRQCFRGLQDRSLDVQELSESLADLDTEEQIKVGDGVEELS